MTYKRYKKDLPYSYTYGVFPTLELLQARPEHVLQVYAATRGAQNAGVAKIEALCARHGLAFAVDDRAIARLAPAENHYAVGVFRKYAGALTGAANHVVLVQPGDAGNLGTIARTLLGFGVPQLGLIRPAVDVFDPRALRASMGALFHLACAYYDDFDAYRAEFPGQQLYPFMTTAAVPLFAARFAAPFTLVFGNESAGLPGEFSRLGTAVYIPHSAAIDSLNLPLAVGLGLYEAAGRAQSALA